ncbi:MAG: hypothetical protein R3336_09675, partial [Phycisphaeraceae bacterium]|nr:hypothetical protein [Phycisphaeraceae bacterium]
MLLSIVGLASGQTTQPTETGEEGAEKKIELTAEKILHHAWVERIDFDADIYFEEDGTVRHRSQSFRVGISMRFKESSDFVVMGHRGVRLKTARTDAGALVQEGQPDGDWEVEYRLDEHNDNEFSTYLSFGPPPAGGTRIEQIKGVLPLAVAHGKMLEAKVGPMKKIVAREVRVRNAGDVRFT